MRTFAQFLEAHQYLLPDYEVILDVNNPDKAKIVSRDSLKLVGVINSKRAGIKDTPKRVHHFVAVLKHMRVLFLQGRK